MCRIRRPTELASNTSMIDGVRALCASPSLGRLRSLDLSGNFPLPLGEAAAQILASAPGLGELRKLVLLDNGPAFLPGAAGWKLLAESPCLRRLVVLSVPGQGDAERVGRGNSGR